MGLYDRSVGEGGADAGFSRGADEASALHYCA